MRLQTHQESRESITGPFGTPDKTHQLLLVANTKLFVIFLALRSGYSGFLPLLSNQGGTEYEVLGVKVTPRATT